jgi:hypothetical protein
MSGTALSIGQFAELSAAVLKALPRNMSSADALAWAQNGEKLSAALASALCPLGTPMPQIQPAVLPEQLTLSVDYGKPLEQMISAGRYDWKNDDITAKRFPVVGQDIEQFEAKIFHFDCHMSSEAVVEAIKAAGWEPGKIEHLLSFGVKYPEEQRKYPIIALGSGALVGGGRRVPGLSRRGAERGLRLGWWGRGWDGDYRFLAVRAVVQPGKQSSVA